MRLFLGFVSLFLALPIFAQAPAPEADPVLRAMIDEIERSRALKVVDLDKPYYIGSGQDWRLRFR